MPKSGSFPVSLAFTRPVDVEDLRLNYDPVNPQARFRQLGIAALETGATQRLPSAPPWPKDAAPVAAPLPHAPAETDTLTRFRGYDAVVVTWTAAEAAALAVLLSPGHLPAAWYQYKHDVAAYIPLVTGGRAPFNDHSPEMARYYHSLGLYFPCRIGAARVLLFKSGLHFDYDGPDVPVKKLMAEIAAAIEPQIFITTGTGGGIGKAVRLADVVIAPRTRFDCATQFKAQPWARATYRTARLPAAALRAITPALLGANAARVPQARTHPKVWRGPGDAIVTTDFFGFDDSTNHFKLQRLGRACDMGDAMVAQALQAFRKIRFYAIRNVSDPQIPNPRHALAAAEQAAGKIYAEYGAFTTASSVIASWAVIHAASAAHKPKARAARAGAK
ncbi:MAG: hypothetical protein ACRD1L_12990 [Terriglobales bacterium]